MKPVAAMVATAVLLLAGLLGPFGGGIGAAAAAAPAQGARDPGPTLRLDLTDMSPRVVTASGPGTLTVTGTLVNTGDRPVDDLVARVQRSDVLGSEGAVRDALDGATATDAVAPQFQPLADTIAPGESVPVQLTVRLRGTPEGGGLAMGRRGVYEILVNVNGTPQGAPAARVAAVRMLLPVQSLPADGSGPAVVEPFADPAAVPFSMLYPITERPHRISTMPGQRTTLDDDTLAASFAAGGRLDGVVSALAQEAPAGSPTRAAVCLAIDPDLVETAAAMAAGYEVRAPDGTITPGTGADAAGRWLTQLTAVARGGCVLALPFADADLVALTRGGLGAAAVTAVTDGRQVLTEVLGLTAPLLPVTWPADGALDEPTLEATAQLDDRSLVLSADAVAAAAARRTAGVVDLAGTSRFAVLTDPLLTASAGRSGATTSGLGIGAAAAATSPAGTASPLSTQDAIGALAFRAQATTAPGTAPTVLAPPRVWAADGVGARALLAAVTRLLGDGDLVPRDVTDVVSAGAGADAPSGELNYPTSVRGREVDSAIVEGIRRDGLGLADLITAAEEPDPGTVGVGPAEGFTPVRRGLVRPVSAALRADPAAAAAVAARGSARIAELRALVNVVEPTIPFSLGTSDAPLPLSVVNGLPVPMRVRVEVSGASGLQVAPIAEQRIPPLGRRQLSVNAKVNRSGQFTVEARVLTPGGGQLGAASRLRVVSTAYGTITVWLTATAGVVLVALIARRVIRRRGDPDHPRGPDLPPDPQDLPQHPGRGPGRGRLPDLPPPAPVVPPAPDGTPTQPLHPRPHGTGAAFRSPTRGR